MVSRAAKDCLSLFDQGGEGACHMMSRRFLQPGFNGGDDDPGLRTQVEHLANGSMMETLDPEQQKQLAFWLGGLKQVLPLAYSLANGFLGDFRLGCSYSYRSPQTYVIRLSAPAVCSSAVQNPRCGSSSVA